MENCNIILTISLFFLVLQPLGRQYQNGDGFGYIIAFKRKTEITWQTFKVPGVHSYQFVYRNETITAYTPFDVKIKAFNHEGEGPYSLETTVYSAEDGKIYFVINISHKED